MKDELIESAVIGRLGAGSTLSVRLLLGRQASYGGKERHDVECSNKNGGLTVSRLEQGNEQGKGEENLRIV